MNIAVSWAGALEWLCYMVIIGFLWRAGAAALADTPIGKAMSVIY